MLVKTERFQYFIRVKRIVAQICAYFNILLDVEVGYEIVLLEDISEVLPAIQRQPFLVHICGLFAVYGNISAVGTVDTSYDIQKGGLARAGRTEQYAYFSFFDFGINSVQHFNTAVALTEVLSYLFDSKKHFTFFLSYCSVHTDCTALLN